MTAVADVSDRSLAQLVSLAGRVAVVTGGARGLGKAIAQRLCEAGADVVLGDVEEELARTSAEELASRFGVKVLGVRMDVANSASVAAVADLAESQLGGLHIWVNNAGIFPAKPATDMDDATWNRVFDINVRGLFAGAREAARRMKPDAGGVIINIVSTAGFKGIAPGLSAYVGSKHAVRGITKQLALELAPRIRVLGVAPTYCVTEGNILAAQEHGPVDPADVQIGAMLTSRLGRVGVPDDIARAVLFCASDLAIFMTGSTLLVDAGETI